MMDATLGYILCSQSPTLFLGAAVLLLCYFARRHTHRARAILDLTACIVCTAAAVAMYFLGMGKGYFTIRDFYRIRTPGWVGMAVVAVIALWLAVRAFLAASRRRTAEKAAARAANAEAHRRAEEERAAAQQREAAEKAANAAAVAHVSATVNHTLTPSPAPWEATQETPAQETPVQEAPADVSGE